LQEASWTIEVYRGFDLRRGTCNSATGNLTTQLVNVAPGFRRSSVQAADPTILDEWVANSGAISSGLLLFAIGTELG